MHKPMQAAAVLSTHAPEPRRPKPSDTRLHVSFSVLEEPGDLERLSHPPADAEPAPESGARYAPHAGEGGLGLYGQLRALGGRALRPGDLLKMEIRAARHRSLVRCLGRVSWVRLYRDAGLFGAGVGFVGVDPRDLAAN